MGRVQGGAVARFLNGLTLRHHWYLECQHPPGQVGALVLDQDVGGWVQLLIEAAQVPLVEIEVGQPLGVPVYNCRALGREILEIIKLQRLQRFDGGGCFNCHYPRKWSPDS